ncbi:MAG: peptidoglycan DD-metalloendopeptidase family protein [Candidatus Lokiarchaeota archaeon]|nr:peptidoglycan DD-metalloendopeptidase family protein [Candidatus Lokiarchaeota archaeon]
MNKKTAALLLIVVIVVSSVVLFVLRGRTGILFDAGDRYDSTKLDYMNVVYENRTDILAFNEGYSESDNCPWGFEHNGIDYFLANDSVVIAAAPGQVIDIEWKDYGEGEENRFHIRITIRFNATVEIGYNFEPWTQNEADKNQQIAMFDVEVGEWVEIGDKIASFLNVGDGAHIHFDVIQDNTRYCPKQYFSQEGYAEIMEMIHSFHPTWELCYP